ncbi:MAG TPA: hypothetical protein VFT04_14160 [Gemmatimonadales bacterium]|nr:hypothetical protein [Gemmatimonadales bacterium]
MGASSAEDRPGGDDAPLGFRDIAVVGGGCYGSFYAGQLERARERGRVAYRRLLIVDRNPACQAAQGDRPADRILVVQEWSDFFDAWLGGEAGAGDAIVPSPLMPHLMFEWLLRRSTARWPGRRVDAEPVTVEARTPYEMPAPDGVRYLSHADWLCPTHCIEPAQCPVIRAPRTWEMTDTLEEMTRRLGRTTRVAGPVALRCRHRAFGVGMFDAEEVLAADSLVAEAGRSGDEVRILIGTVSSCHGAVGMLALGGAEVPSPSIFHPGRGTDEPAPGRTPATFGEIGNG